MSIAEQADLSPALVDATVDAGVRRITLSNPPANALSLAMLEALVGAVEDASSDRDTRVVVIAGATRIFSAGHDLKEITAHRNDPDRGRAFYEQLMARCGALMQAIVHLPKPVIAEVAGIATAAGCQLVANCDLVVASQDARFQTPGVDIGLFCSMPMVPLSRKVHRKHAMEMLLGGEPISAARAYEMGLVNRVVPAAELEIVTREMAQLIASKPAAIVKIGKEAFYAQAEMPLAEAYAYTARVMTENMLAAEAEEGIGAFVEKRKPRWPGP